MTIILTGYFLLHKQLVSAFHVVWKKKFIHTVCYRARIEDLANVPFLCEGHTELLVQGICERLLHISLDACFRVPFLAQVQLPCLSQRFQKSFLFVCRYISSRLYFYLLHDLYLMTSLFSCLLHCKLDEKRSIWGRQLLRIQQQLRV